MKIRYLIANAYAVGGTVRTTYNMAGELAKRHDVEIVSVYRLREEPAFAVPPGVELRCLVDISPERVAELQSGRGPVRSAHRATREWALGQPSRLIHPKDFRFPKFSLLTDLRLLRYIRSVHDGVLIATRAGLNLAVAQFAHPSVIRIGQEHLNMRLYGPHLRAAFQKYYPRLDLYAALTEGDTAAFRKLLGNRMRLECVPNAVSDIGSFRAPLDSKVVVAAGRLASQKGFDRLIPAWAQVAAKHPDWELRIFGDGPLRETLTQQVEELGIGASVKMPGFTDNLPYELSQGSIYVMSSRFEGFPMVLLEAMGSGLPVVSFDCPNGPRDLITPGEDGLLVPNGDVDGLAAALIDLIELGEGRTAFGAAARAKLQRYAMPVVAARWEQLIGELADARSGSSRGRPRPGID